MENAEATPQAAVYSVLLHLGIVGFLALALLNCSQWEDAFSALHLPVWLSPVQCTRPTAMPGPVIEATLVGPTAAPKAKAVPARPKPAPAPPPKPVPPAPAPAAEPPPTEVARQDLIDRERIVALAQEKAEQQQKEQAERIHQQQVELDEQKRKQGEEARKRQQLAEIRQQREALERKLAKEKDRLQQLEDLSKVDQKAVGPAVPAAEHEAPQAQTGAGGADNDLAARYAAAIQAAVTNNWNRPDSAQPGLRCTLDIVQIPGGDVISAKVTAPCTADPVTRNSIEQAVMKAAPLPYQGYEKVFRREITFNFKYDG